MFEEMVFIIKQIPDIILEDVDNHNYIRTKNIPRSECTSVTMYHPVYNIT